MREKYVRNGQHQAQVKNTRTVTPSGSQLRSATACLSRRLVFSDFVASAMSVLTSDWNPVLTNVCIRPQPSMAWLDIGWLVGWVVG